MDLFAIHVNKCANIRLQLDNETWRRMSNRENKDINNTGNKSSSNNENRFIIIMKTRSILMSIVTMNNCFKMDAGWR